MTRSEMIATVILSSVLCLGVYLGFAKVMADNEHQPVVEAVKVNEEAKLSYMTDNLLTDDQARYVLELSYGMQDPDHFIGRFTAIFRHEQGTYFVNGKSRYLAGRLKKDLAYKPFREQMDGRADQYRRRRYKNYTVSDRIDRSHYCVSDTHGGGAGCPNWKKSVPRIRSQYTGEGETIPTPTKAIGAYKKARDAQDRLDRLIVETPTLWDECKKSGECKE